MDALEEKLLSMIHSVPFEVSLALQSPFGEIGISDEVVYSSASTIKIPILAELSQQIKEGKATWEQEVVIQEENKVEFSRIRELHRDRFTLKELARWMIYVSDNTATNQLIDFLTVERINERIQKLGGRKTILQRKMMDTLSMKQGRDNFTTAKDMVEILKNMAPENREILCGNRDESGLIRYIDDPVQVAKKSGELEGIYHDVGIFYLKNTSYVLALLTRGAEEKEEALKTIGLLSKIIYDDIKERISES